MPHVYGFEHILYLLFFAAVYTVSFILIKKYAVTEKQKTLTVRIVGIILLSAVAANRVSLAVVDSDVSKLIPDTFCGLSSFLLAVFTAFGKKDNIGLHCVSYIGALGGLLTLAYPDFIGQAQSIFYPCTITGLLHHTVMVFQFILILKTGFLKPTYKKWYALVFGGCAYMTLGLFLYQVFGRTDAMYIGAPILGGTSLYWYILLPLFGVIYAVFITVWELCRRYRARHKHQS